VITRVGWAETSHRRLLAFELRRWEMQLGPIAAGIFQQAINSNSSIAAGGSCLYPNQCLANFSRTVTGSLNAAKVHDFAGFFDSNPACAAVKRVLFAHLKRIFRLTQLLCFGESGLYCPLRDSRTRCQRFDRWVKTSALEIDVSGLPLPAFPTLMATAALVTQNRYQVSEIILAGVAGSLIADLAGYWSGRRYGRRILGLLCKMSLSPDFCVSQTETAFTKVGPWSLPFAKFFPGLSIISVAMAGVTKISLPAFLLLSGIGAFLSVSVPVVLGRIFHDAITDILSTLADIGKFGVLSVLAVLAASHGSVSICGSRVSSTYWAMSI
jgi:membrane protein DedA with SNARE-associated domain